MQASESPVRARSAGTARRSSPSRTLHLDVVDELGLAIIERRFRPGATVTIEDLERTHQVSRSVVREALRVLESLGMISSRRRVGVQVLPEREWNLYDSRLIHWRLESGERARQLRSLTELRTAVEPQAARLAAGRAALEEAGDLVGLAGRLWAAGRAGDQDQFLELDIRFHQLILRSSGNEMFAKLDELITEVLSGRTHHGLMPRYPHTEALQLHLDVAGAIQAGRQDDAQRLMELLVGHASEELREVLSTAEATPEA